MHWRDGYLSYLVPGKKGRGAIGFTEEDTIVPEVGGRDSVLRSPERGTGSSILLSTSA